MNRRLFFGLSALLALASLRPRRAAAQPKGMKDQLAGAWTLAAVTGERADGSRFEPFGAAPKGIIVFTGDGHFSLFQSSGAVPRIAANDRAKATADEATAIVREAIAYYGTYTLNEADKTLSVKLDGSTYANLVGGPEQKRIITSLTADELKFTNPRTPAGITLLTVWTRAKPR
jgi:hypothetical protein